MIEVLRVIISLADHAHLRVMTRVLHEISLSSPVILFLRGDLDSHRAVSVAIYHRLPADYFASIARLATPDLDLIEGFS